MTNRKKIVGNTGKAPGSPKQIPEHLYNILEGFKNTYGKDTMHEYLMFMLTECELTNSADGKYYSYLTGFVFELMIAIAFIDKYIPGEFEKRKVA